VLEDYGIRDKFWSISRAPANVQKMAELMARPFVGYNDIVWLIIEEAISEDINQYSEHPDWRSRTDEELKEVGRLVYEWFTSEEFAAAHPGFNFLQQHHWITWRNVAGLEIYGGRVCLLGVVNDCYRVSANRGTLVKL